MSFRRRKDALLIWLPLFLSSTVAGRAEQLPMVVFSVRDGIPPYVDRIAVDSRGSVWFPGPEGLVRFDGNGFRVFAEPDGLPESGASDILERRDGTYWVTAGERLCVFEPRPARERFRCEFPKLAVINALLADDETLRCGTDSGLWHRPANGVQPWESLPENAPGDEFGTSSVHRLLKDSRAMFGPPRSRACTRFRSNGGVDHWPPALGLVTDPNTALSETPGGIWAGAQSYLFEFEIDPQTGEARIAHRYDRSDGLPSGYATDVHEWRGTLYAATFQGLARQSARGRWEPVGLDPSFDGLPLESLATDHFGNLWWEPTAVNHYQSLSDAELAGQGALLVCLRETGSRTDPQIKNMSADDMRNTVIVEVAAQTGSPVVNLQALSDMELIRVALGRDSFIRGVLLLGRFRTQRQLNAMSAEDQRNTLIAELVKRTKDTLSHYQSLNDAGLAGEGALLVYLRETGSRTDQQIKTMSADDMRNTVIVEVGAQTGHSGDLQALGNIDLVKLVLNRPTRFLN